MAGLRGLWKEVRMGRWLGGSKTGKWVHQRRDYAADNLLEGAEVINWYPGHMASASRNIREQIRGVDLVLEIRDARIPLSSANQELQEVLSRKKRLIVLNKMDLANPNMMLKWRDYFKSCGQNLVFVNAHHSKTVKKMLDVARGQLRSAMAKERTLLVMVVGIPNVGKSCLINTMSAITRATFSVQGQPKKAKVGPLPGVTQHVAGFKIGEKPSTYVLDTPGVLVPNIQDIEMGIKLSLTGAVKDTIVGQERLARYLLSVLNARSAHLRWNKAFATETEGKDSESLLAVREVLASACLKFDGNMEDKQDMESLVDTQMHILRKVFHVPTELGEAGMERVSQHVLELYRKGKLGKYTLDIVPGVKSKVIDPGLL
ncbi:unnamed protein product [Calypogeia fissa]